MKTKLALAVFTSVVLLWPQTSALAATFIWDGGGTDNNWTTATNWVGDVAPSAGDDLVFPGGAARPNSANVFPAGTLFNSITISGGSYSLSGSNIVLNAGINATNTIFQNTWWIPLTLNSNQTITTGNAAVNFFLRGPIDTNGRDLTFAGNGLAQVTSVISGTGGLVKTGTGGALLYTNNTFSGTVQILGGIVAIYHGHALGDTSGSTIIAEGAGLFANNAIGVAEPLILYGTFNSGGAGAKTWTGPITLASSAATITAVSTAPMTINAMISGSHGFTKSADGMLTLNSNNTYTGTTTVEEGTLIVNGHQPSSAILLVQGAVGGGGTVGNISVSGSWTKTLRPGGSPGILTCSDVTLNPTTTFEIELNGATAGSGYDQLNVLGSVTLGNALLSVTLGFVPASNTAFQIINNNGTDAINGTFGGLPEGAILNVGTNQLKISYAGGDGNDVVLTPVASGPPRLWIEPVPPASIRLFWATNNAAGFSLQSNTNLSTTNWIVVSPAPVVAGSNHVVTNAASGRERYYRLLKP